MLAEHPTPTTTDTPRPDPLWAALAALHSGGRESISGLAARLGVNPGTLASWLSGRRHARTADLLRVAAAVGATVDITPTGPRPDATRWETWQVRWADGSLAAKNLTETAARSIARHTPGARLTRVVHTTSEQEVVA